ncbi:MAG: HAD-IIA family hydrolase [Actinomycetota bacterium]
MSLADAYEAFLLDLDGVLYRGDQPIDPAAATVEALRSAGKQIVFLTNNSASTAAQVAAKLNGMGISANESEVLSSARATGDMLASEGKARARTAFVIGRDGVRSALADAGIDLVNGDVGHAELVVVGWDPDVTYEALRRATVLVRAGARLIATNADASYPAPGGELWPGAGAILAAVETASGESATVVGKPHAPMFEAAVAAVGTRNVLVVGDRVETDIVGAANAGLDAAMVRSGAGTPAQLLDQDALPVAILSDIGGLLSSPPVARPRPAKAEDMQDVRALTEAPADAPDWGPSGVHVVEDDGIEATATAHVLDRDAYLRAVATSEGLRGGGLGTLIVVTALRDARRQGAQQAWLLTETAEPFFAKLGFERAERGSMPGWIGAGPGEGCPQTAVAMRRALAQ